MALAEPSVYPLLSWTKPSNCSAPVEDIRQALGQVRPLQASPFVADACYFSKPIKGA